jgi:hypothetical protein
MVEQIREDFQDSGAIEVIIKREADETFSVTGVFE